MELSLQEGLLHMLLLYCRRGTDRLSEAVCFARALSLLRPSCWGTAPSHARTVCSTQPLYLQPLLRATSAGPFLPPCFVLLIEKPFLQQAPHQRSLEPAPRGTGNHCAARIVPQEHEITYPPAIARREGSSTVAPSTNSPASLAAPTVNPLRIPSSAQL